MTATIEDLHHKMLYTCARVRTPKAGGSGTVLYSKPNAQGDHSTYLLTNWHVIESAITIKDEWDPLRARNIKKEYRATITVETFRYVHLSTVVGSQAMDADVMAWDKEEDLALVKLRDIAAYPSVAKLYPKGEERDIPLFSPVFACGAALLHVPYPTEGRITSKNDDIENKVYFMSTASTTYGNSGGAVFLSDTLEMIGVPSRIALQGWGDVANHMGFFIPPDRIYGFLEKEGYQFIYDPSLTEEQCAEIRKRKREQAERVEQMIARGVVPPTPEAPEGGSGEPLQE